MPWTSTRDLQQAYGIPPTSNNVSKATQAMFGWHRFSFFNAIPCKTSRTCVCQRPPHPPRRVPSSYRPHHIPGPSLLARWRLVNLRCSVLTTSSGSNLWFACTYIYDAVFLPQYQYASVGVPSNKAKRICAAEKRLSSPAFGAS